MDTIEKLLDCECVLRVVGFLLDGCRADRLLAAIFDLIGGKEPQVLYDIAFGHTVPPLSTREPIVVLPKVSKIGHAHGLQHMLASSAKHWP